VSMADHDFLAGDLPRLRTCPTTVHLSLQPVPDIEHAADRTAELRTGPVTIATAASGTRTTPRTLLRAARSHWLGSRSPR
jgi:hypothetical protein